MPSESSLGGRAAEDLAYVRQVLERTEHFSAVPGAGGIGMGLIALVAAWLAHRQASSDHWATVWVGAALLAALLGAFSLRRKARRYRLPLDGAAARRFSGGLLPPLLLGMVLTFAAFRTAAWGMLVPLWLGCYAVAILAAGAVSSVRIVPRFGAALLFLAALATVLPLSWHDGLMALGFGAGHLITGEIVRRRYGG